MARTKEQRSWDTFKAHIDGRQILTVRVENMVGNATPDVIAVNRKGVTFWIENKAIGRFPVRAATPVLGSAFEPGQLSFARAWMNKGGYSFVLLRVDQAYYLLDPRLPLEEQNTHELCEHALAATKSRIIEYLEDME